jgi:hypothetical protein
MISTQAWVLCYAANVVFWLWVILWGGAEWLEGTFASAFLVSWLAPTWSAEGIKLFAWLALLFTLIAFVVGFFVPSLRCWSSSC